MVIETPIGKLRIDCQENHESHQNYVKEVLLPGWKENTVSSNIQPKSTYEEEVSYAFENYFFSQQPSQVQKAWKKLVEIAQPEKIISSYSRFSARVYRSLIIDVSTGTISYSELAEIAGSPRASRAVGSAMRKNILPIIIPCHRVIASNGKIGGYMGATVHEALTIKRWLLNHEGNFI